LERSKDFKNLHQIAPDFKKVAKKSPKVAKKSPKILVVRIFLLTLQRI